MRRSEAGCRNAFSLVEILLSVAIMAGLGGALMTMLSRNSEVSARASEMQMASLVGARVMDRLVALNFPRLKHRLDKNGPDGQIDLTKLGGHEGRGRRKRGEAPDGQGRPDGAGESDRPGGG